MQTIEFRLAEIRERETLLRRIRVADHAGRESAARSGTASASR